MKSNMCKLTLEEIAPLKPELDLGWIYSKEGIIVFNEKGETYLLKGAEDKYEILLYKDKLLTSEKLILNWEKILKLQSKKIRTENFLWKEDFLDLSNYTELSCSKSSIKIPTVNKQSEGKIRKINLMPFLSNLYKAFKELDGYLKDKAFRMYCYPLGWIFTEQGLLIISSAGNHWLIKKGSSVNIPISIRYYDNETCSEQEYDCYPEFKAIGLTWATVKGQSLQKVSKLDSFYSYPKFTPDLSIYKEKFTNIDSIPVEPRILPPPEGGAYDIGEKEFEAAKWRRGRDKETIFYGILSSRGFDRDKFCIQHGLDPKEMHEYAKTVVFSQNTIDLLAGKFD